MQSTGEVIGIHEDARVAMAKALLAASMLPPVGGVVLLSVADRDKRALPDLAAALNAAGCRFAATSGTAAVLRELGHEVLEVGRLGEDASGPDVVGRTAMADLLAAPDLALIINTPSPSSGAVRDAAAIRHAAIGQGTLCLTSVDTALAAAQAMQPEVRARVSEIRPLAIRSRAR